MVELLGPTGETKLIQRDSMEISRNTTGYAFGGDDEGFEGFFLCCVGIFFVW